MDLMKTEIHKLCNEYGFENWELALAIARKESSFDKYSVRPEPNFKYFYFDDMSLYNHYKKYIKKNGFKLYRNLIRKMLNEWEFGGQTTSHGLFQIMGATARWLGLEGNLSQLYDIEINFKYFKKYYDWLSKKYAGYIPDIISAYNQGGRYFEDKNKNGLKDSNEKYNNQYYVDRVMQFRNEFQKEYR